MTLDAECRLFRVTIKPVIVSDVMTSVVMLIVVVVTAKADFEVVFEWLKNELGTSCEWDGYELFGIPSGIHKMFSIGKFKFLSRNLDIQWTKNYLILRVTNLSSEPSFSLTQTSPFA